MMMVLPDRSYFPEAVSGGGIFPLVTRRFFIRAVFGFFSIPASFMFGKTGKFHPTMEAIHFRKESWIYEAQ